MAAPALESRARRQQLSGTVETWGMDAVPEHVQLTLDGLRGDLVATRTRCDQIEFAIASLCLVYGIETARVDGAKVPRDPERPPAPTLVAALNAEERVQALRRPRPTREMVIDTLRAGPPIGLGADEVTEKLHPSLGGSARAVATKRIEKVLEQLVAAGTAEREDRLYRPASAA